MVGDVLVECAEACNIGWLRQDDSKFLDREKELQHKHFTSDGTHTNAEGARHNARIIAEMVPLMLRKY